MELTPEEKELIARIGFDQSVASLIKSLCLEPLEQMMGLDDDYDEVPLDALTTPLSRPQQPANEERTQSLFANIRTQLLPKGYHVFLTRQSLILSLVILKTDDQFQFLRWIKTNGDNYDVTNSDVVERLRDWDSRYGIEIWEAAHDLVQMNLLSIPQDLAAFAQEVYEFCPDTVDQGTGLVGDYENLQAYGWEIDPAEMKDLNSTDRGVRLLAAEIKKNSGVYLWWD
jgi:hypothetical protein